MKGLLANLRPDQPQESSDLLHRLARLVHRKAERRFTIEETGDSVFQRRGCQPLETYRERLSRLEPEGGQFEHDDIVGTVGLGLGKHAESSVMSGSMRSAGLLPYRIDSRLEVLVAHPGGPYFARRDEGWWSVIKGMVEADETDAEAAEREFAEETGWPAPSSGWLDLGETRLRSRKIVRAWGVEADYEPATLKPGMFQMGSRLYPEIDRVEWMDPDLARSKLNPAQTVFVDRLIDLLSF